MVLLALDYGRSRIGLALADGPLARPLSVWPNKKNTVTKIAALCDQESVKKIIIGLPEGELKKEVKKFAQKLTQLTSLPIEFQSETLTTQEAIAKMIAVGKPQRVRQKFKDAFAAALILQNYLDVQSSRQKGGCQN
jgi:putative Holliday junction resolvase